MSADPAAADAATATANAVAKTGNLLMHFVSNLQTSAAAMKESSVSMAKQIAMRIYQISGAMSGKCALVTGEDTANMALPTDHKELFDELRRNRPTAYESLLSTARRFAATDTNAQLDVLTADLPIVMQSLR